MASNDTNMLINEHVAASSNNLDELKSEINHPRGKMTSAKVGPLISPIQGGCTFFIARKDRYCSNKASLGSLQCSKHRSFPIEQSTKAISPPNLILAGRKQNQKRPLKRMLNPFFIRHCDPIDWQSAFTKEQRTWLDIGCAKGGYLHQCRSSNTWNCIGVEIYDPLVRQANDQESKRNSNSQSNLMKNLFFVTANINTSLEFMQIPNLARVSLLFPDPWACGIKSTKNSKRRVMNLEFGCRIARVMQSAGEIYFCSDWHELALDILECLMATKCFDLPIGEASNDGMISLEPYVPSLTVLQLNSSSLDHILNSTTPDFHDHDSSKIECTDKTINLASSDRLIDVCKKFDKPVFDDGTLWLAGIPFGGIMTERDVVCETQWRSVYRLVLIRNNNQV